MSSDQADPGTPSLTTQGVKPAISPLQQWFALTARGTNGVFRNGELLFAIISPIFLAVCFYLPLQSIMNSQPGMNYAQFLMPIIILQSVGFAGSSSAMRAAVDTDKGINTRFRVLPMSSTVPPAARLATNTFLLVVSLVFATIICLIIGWRPGGGVGGTIGLYVIALAVGIALALVADGIGLISNGPESTSQLMSLPILILGMCSTGFVAVEQFPEWIQPFVRNQPVSQFTDAMRAFDEGRASWALIGPSVWWILGIIAAAVVLNVIGTRRANR